MPFPAVQTTATSVNDAGGTSHTVTLPSGIQSGDLLIAGFCTWADETHTWPGGWTQIYDAAYPGNLIRASVYYRQADGLEGASITVTTNTGVDSAHIAYRISGAENPGAQAPEIAVATFISANPDPPSLTPTGGAKDYLWLAWSLNRRAHASAYPTNYSNGITARVSEGADGECCTSGAERQLNASSEDPGTFTIAASRYGHAATIAVHPSTGPSLSVSDSISISESKDSLLPYLVPEMSEGNVDAWERGVDII